MPISLLRWLTFLVSLSFLLIYFKGGTIVMKDAQRSLSNAAGRPYMIVVTLMILPALTILLTQLLVCLGIVRVVWAQQLWMVTLGTLLAVTGIAATFWIRHRYLGRFWSGGIEIQEQHNVVDRGPYRTVRHPLYAVTALMIYPGVALAFGAWWNWMACGMMMVGYIWLAAHEDRFLEANLPGYREYQQRTRYKVVPGIW